MADVRALLAAEKSSRRISHPYAIYTKSGVLSCQACSLAIKSETLWEGHLKSANHRKNAAKAAATQLNQEYSTNGHPSQQATKQLSAAAAPAIATRNLKRKIEELDEDDTEHERRDIELDSRKKARSAVEDSALLVSDNRSQQQPILSSTSETEKTGTRNKHVHFSPSVDDADGVVDTDARVGQVSKSPRGDRETSVETQVTGISQRESSSNTVEAGSHTDSSTRNSDNSDTRAQGEPIDEDEWAAFESEMTNLESEAKATSTSLSMNPASNYNQNHIPSKSKNGNSNNNHHLQNEQNKTLTENSRTDTVITAAPISTQEIQQQRQQQQEENKRNKLLDTELEDEKEEESRRMEEEFQVMQEMEDKIRRLKEKRESLRIGFSASTLSSLAAAGTAESDPTSLSAVIANNTGPIDSNVSSEVMVDTNVDVDVDDDANENQDQDQDQDQEDNRRSPYTALTRNSRDDDDDDDDNDDNNDDDTGSDDQSFSKPTLLAGAAGGSNSNSNSINNKSNNNDEYDDNDDDDEDEDEDDWYA